MLNTSLIPSRQPQSSAYSAENALPAAANTAPAYPARSRETLAHPDPQTPSRKEWPQSLPRFHLSSCPREPPARDSSSSPTLKSCLHPTAATSADRSLQSRCPLLPEPQPLPANCASSPHTKGSSGACPRVAPPPFRWAPYNLPPATLP